MRYEIRVIGDADSTTSGPLNLPYEEARKLFEQEGENLDEGLRVELSNYDTEEVLDTTHGTN